MRNKKPVLALKYTVYALCVAALFVLQSIPGMFSIFGVKPNLVAAAAIAIALYEDEFIGGIYGAFCGVLCDFGGFTIFGFNAIIFLISGVACGLLIIYMLRPTWVNYSLLLCGAMLTRGLLDYLLNFLMWGYDDSHTLLLTRVLPSVAYTVAAGPLVYLLYGYLHRVFAAKLES